MYIAACGIGRKKPIGFRPTGYSSAYIQLFTAYIIATIHLRCNAFFLQYKPFFSNQIAFLHLSITLLYYSFTILCSPEQLHVCNLPHALVPYIRIQQAARRCSLLFVHPDAPCIRVYHGGWTASTKSRAILMAELMFVPVCGSFLLLPGH